MTGPKRQPNYHARRLTRELVRLREESNRSQAYVARLLAHFDLEKLVGFENGELPGYDDLCAMLEAYDTPPEVLARLLVTWESAAEFNWWDRAEPHPDVTCVAMEHEALVIRDYQITRLPDLLQTSTYARKLGPSPQSSFTHPDTIGQRQHSFYSRRFAFLSCLIDERVLTADLDEHQLRTLLNRATAGRVTIRVVPAREQHLDLVPGHFTLLSFPDADEPDFAYVSHPLGTTYTQDPDRTTALRQKFNAIDKVALTEDESVAYIEALLNERVSIEESA